LVTGVQTCALPIFPMSGRSPDDRAHAYRVSVRVTVDSTAASGEPDRKARIARRHRVDTPHRPRDAARPADYDLQGRGTPRRRIVEPAWGAGCESKRLCRGQRTATSS